MNREELIDALGWLGYSLVEPTPPKVSESHALALLRELAGSTEPRLVEGFPYVLASCAQRGIKLNRNKLLPGDAHDIPVQRDLEKLVLLSADLLESEGLDTPDGFDETLDILKSKYGNLLDSDAVMLESGVSLSVERLRNTLRRYAADFVRSETTRQRGRNKQKRTFELHLHLSTLFSPKQKELVLKKLHGERLTKTEQEYYSRVVKKKLEALADAEVRKVALTLTKR
jgi:hypothetical protein